jgi:hypothetical protein
MCTSSHPDNAIHAATDRARARRFWHAVIDHTPTLVAEGMERPGDAERYYMAWLSAYALADAPLPPLRAPAVTAAARNGAGSRELSRQPGCRPGLGPSSGVCRPFAPAPAS